MKPKYDLDGNLVKPKKCKHCGREKGDHLAKTFNCPFGGSRSFPNFRTAQFFELPESDSKNLPSHPKENAHKLVGALLETVDTGGKAGI